MISTNSTLASVVVVRKAKKTRKFQCTGQRVIDTFSSQLQKEQQLYQDHSEFGKTVVQTPNRKWAEGYRSVRRLWGTWKRNDRRIERIPELIDQQLANRSWNVQSNRKHSNMPVAAREGLFTLASRLRNTP